MGNKSFLYLHDWYSIANGWDWNTIYILPGQNIGLSFSKKRFELMKSPYVTDCIDYKTTTNFVSQYECVFHCSITTSLDKCHVIAEDVNVYPKQTGRFTRNKQERNCTKRLNVDRFCYDRCPHPDCNIDHFQAIKFYNSLRNDGKPDATVNLRIPSEPQTIYNSKPKIETIEFLCYCASLISLWFGFSFASIYYPIKRLKDWFDSRSKEKKFSKKERFIKLFCFKKYSRQSILKADLHVKHIINLYHTQC